MRRLLALAPVVLLLAACGASGSTAASPAGSFASSAAGSAQPRPGTSGAPGPAPAGSPRPAPSGVARTLAQIGLTDGDLQAAGLTGGTLRLIPAGDTLEGATLDVCDGTFASEALRTARRQTAVQIGAEGFVSSEVVQYGSAADALQALTEAGDAAAKGCPTSASSSTDITRHERGAAGLPAADNLVLEQTSQDADAETYGIAVYQVSGATLSAVYLNDSSELTDEARAVATTLARATGNRLVAGGSGAAA